MDAYKEELLKLKEAAHVSAFIEVTSDTENGNSKALLIVDQVKNYKLLTRSKITKGKSRSGQKPC